MHGKYDYPEYRQFVSNLLEDPSEIWIHAYEQEISDAARSLLLALYSYGADARTSRVSEAFGALHAERARRYQFVSRPEDFLLALRELNGAFIKPGHNHSLSFLDPSVLDLMNRVVSNAPDNARDILASTVSFDQVERLLNIAAGAGARSIATAVRDNFARHLPRLMDLAVAERRIAGQAGVVQYQGSSYEYRLEVLARRHTLIPEDALATLLQAVMKKLCVEWESEWADVEETADAVGALLKLPMSLQPLAKTMIPQLCHEIIRTIQQRCSARELALAADLLPPLGAHSGPFHAALRIPRQTGHPFHGKLDTDSTAIWTAIPAQTGH